jgi:subtilase family serine protease
MRSRSGKTKLKILFLANIVILASAFSGFVYVKSLIPDPASFQIADLTLDQTLIQFGKPVQISINLTNVGEAMGNHSVILIVDNVPVGTKTIQLSGGESVIVEFTETKIPEGNHTVQIVDLTEELTVTLEAPPEAADIQVTFLGISRTQAMVGEKITICARA